MKLYGLIGYPLSHSFSPQYFNDKFIREKIQAEYRAFPISKLSDIYDIIEDHPQLKGFNITVPYKAEILQYLTKTEDKVKDIQAVNTVCVNRTGKDISLSGYNTDVDGFSLSVQPLLKNKDIHAALILGTGGTSKAVKYALNQFGIETIRITRGMSKPGDKILNYKDITKELLVKSTLIVNTTPLGMFPETSNLPDIPYEYITSDHILFDVIYNPSRTLFLEEGAKKGALVKNGYEMLVLQANKSWEIWNSKSC